jgi:hypothetical protein
MRATARHVLVGLVMVSAWLMLGLVFQPGSGEAGTDPQCFANCTARGNMPGYCRQACSTGDDQPLNLSPPVQPRSPQPPPLVLPPIRKLDPQCMSDCVGRGSMPNYCQRVCLY